MRNQWLEKNVDLHLLAENIKPFFGETYFENTIEEIQEGYLIQAVSKIPNLKLGITVTIQGRPNDFTIEFSSGTKRGHFSPSIIVGSLTEMFGGGFLISREAKKQEILDGLEKDFWKHTQMRVADLADSASPRTKQGKTS